MSFALGPVKGLELEFFENPKKNHSPKIKDCGIESRELSATLRIWKLVSPLALFEIVENQKKKNIEGSTACCCCFAMTNYLGGKNHTKKYSKEKIGCA